MGKAATAQEPQSPPYAQSKAKGEINGAKGWTSLPKPGGQYARREAVVMRPRTKDPQGGLTAAGRAEFRRKQGSRLRPGVKKTKSEMTPEDMRRKGSWACRFYGRKGRLPPLRKPSGEPTRFALTAAAWGEPVPKTQAEARRIAAKGRALLESYQRTKKAG